MSSYERRQIEQQLRAMVNEIRKSHPDWPLDIVWGHVDGASQILGMTRLLHYSERLAIVKDAYDNWRGAND